MEKQEKTDGRDLMAEKQVKVKVATDVEDSEVDALEAKIKQLRQQKIQFQIDTNTSKLEQVRAKIQELENKKATLDVDANDAEIKKIEAEIEKLKFEEIDLDLKIRQDEISKVKSEIDSMDPSEIDVNVNNQTALQSLDQISQGVDRLKQGASDLASNIGEVQQAAIQSQQNEAFLTLNLGAEKAKENVQAINDIVASMPGDDNTMRSILSSAQALGAELSKDDMLKGASAMADYMAGSAANGKMMAEVQNDLKDYILTGNTSSLERDSIYKSQIDKLKDQATVQDRINALDKVGNDLGYAGLSQMDTMVKKQGEWEGMMYNASDLLAQMWLPAEGAAMDYIMQLDDASGHLVSMGIVAGQMAGGPLVDMMAGISQIGMGFKTLKEAADFTGITTKLGALKTKLGEVATFVSGNVTKAFQTLKVFLMEDLIPAAKNAALALLDVGKKALISGYNAVKSAALWAAQKLALIASTVAEYGLAAAQALLNVVMSMNPIMLIVIALVALAAALIWAYYNVDWFRQMVDNAWASLVQFGQYIYGVVTGAIQWLGSLFQNFTSQLGLNTNNWIQAILGFILFIPQLPMRLGMELANAIARLLGFKGNFIQHLTSAASNAVSGFVSYIQQLPGIVMGEFNRVLGLVNDFINSLPSRVWDMGAAIIDALKASLGIGSPGHMYYMFEGELERLDKLPETMQGSITHNVGKLGEGIVDSFNPTLGANGYANGSIGGNVINLNVEVGTVDSDDRVQEIVDVIRRELNWNNVTAGRTI